MASKLQEYRRMSEEAQRQLTGTLERWQSFLMTASRLYKYPYHEQVMIHAQRPDATACAEYDEFNVEVAFRHAAQVSISYSLLNRCGLDPNDYLEHEDFMSVFDFNTPDTAAAGHENSKTTIDIYCKLKYNKLEDFRTIVNGAFAGGQNA